MRLLRLLKKVGASDISLLRLGVEDGIRTHGLQSHNLAL